MKRSISILFLGLAHFLHASGQNIYDATNIPENLKQGANLVKRAEDISFEVMDIDRAYYKVHKIITLLNKEAEDYLNFKERTNKYRSLEECEIKVFDHSGNQIQKFKRKDLSKEASGGGLISEGMYNYLSIVAPSYPVTLDINYEIKYSGTLFYEGYVVQDAGEAVQQSSFVLKVPKDLGVRFKEQRIKLTPEKIDDGKNLTYKWSVKDVVAYQEEKEAISEGWSDPSIIIAPNKFKIYNTEGDMSTWKNFGMWESNLIKNLEVLPDERVRFFTALVKDAKSDREKVALVYNYLQQNFRYVSIQLGIGGYQPFPAKFTDEKKYGDCKGLSFYTYSVLKALGIKSHVALINSKYNEEPVDPSFPCNDFTHMILCVPQPHDSIWLECTSKTSDFNYLGSFTENRYALLITDDGGVLVPTPSSNPMHNRVSLRTMVDLKDDGSGQTTSKLYFNGDRRSETDEILTTKEDDQKNFIVKALGFIQPDSFSLKRLDKEDMEINLDLEKIPQFMAGTKMFLRPRICQLWQNVLPSAKDRKQDYFFELLLDKSDTTVYQLPEGFTVDAMPAATAKKCQYATYSTGYAYNKEKNQLTTTASLVLYKNRIPADSYAEVKSFFDEVISDEGQKLVIKKN